MLLRIREYIGIDHEYANTDDCHQIEFMFLCSLKMEPARGLAKEMDPGHLGFDWMEIPKGGDSRGYSKAFMERLASANGEVYCGDID